MIGQRDIHAIRARVVHILIHTRLHVVAAVAQVSRCHSCRNLADGHIHQRNHIVQLVVIARDRCRHLLAAIFNVGGAKAISILAALELGRRRRFAETARQPLIRNSKDAFEYFYMRMADIRHEQFWVLLLNPSNRVIKMAKISDGGVNGTAADPKLIFKTALENNATSIMLCHNHPSGDVLPSDRDKALTRNIINGGKLLEIKILDHIIVGIDNYFSFADSGLI